MNENEKQEIIRKLNVWLKSEEGRTKMEEMRKRTEKIIKDLEEQERIPDEILRKPVTI